MYIYKLIFLLFAAGYLTCNPAKEFDFIKDSYDGDELEKICINGDGAEDSYQI